MAQAHPIPDVGTARFVDAEAAKLMDHENQRLQRIETRSAQILALGGAVLGLMVPLMTIGVPRSAPGPGGAIGQTTVALASKSVLLAFAALGVGLFVALAVVEWRAWGYIGQGYVDPTVILSGRAELTSTTDVELGLRRAMTSARFVVVEINRAITRRKERMLRTMGALVAVEVLLVVALLALRLARI